MTDFKGLPELSNSGSPPAKLEGFPSGSDFWAGTSEAGENLSLVFWGRKGMDGVSFDAEPPPAWLASGLFITSDGIRKVVLIAARLLIGRNPSSKSLET